jgi:hypothetical protein
MTDSKASVPKYVVDEWKTPPPHLLIAWRGGFVHLCTETAGPGDHEKVRWIVSWSMTADVDASGVLLQ